MINPDESSHFLRLNAPLYDAGGRNAPVEQFVRTELRGVKEEDVLSAVEQLVAQALPEATLDEKVALILAAAEIGRASCRERV